MKVSTGKRVFAFVVLVCAAVIAGVAGYSSLKPGQGPISSGTALIGGPFQLTAHTGARVSDKDLEGKYLLIFFGYTYCPDVCPTELQVISAALDQLGDKAKDIQPIFITIDPERDTPDALSKYMPNFHPRYLGLTGSPEEIDRVAKAYRVYYAKAKEVEEGDYLMDHSSIIYLMDKQGTFLKHFSYGTDAKALAAGIEAAIESR
ncbi:MAG TPA: SCO family protein [Aestuariivirgaceae bacterium]|nr:SCO family protein [Aestuariivirgaceae bacterium]